MIGVFGGTFDPVHFGHLRTALEVKEKLDLTEIRLIPCYQPPHRPEPGVAADQRLAMLQMAVAGHSEFVVDAREIERGGPSYMVDTLASLAEEFHDQALVLVIGTDAFLNLTSWHCWTQLFDLAHIAVITRPGYKVGELAPFYRERMIDSSADLRSRKAGALFFLSARLLDISATEIRAIIQAGKNPGFLLSDSVIQYIVDHKLYRHPVPDA